MPPGGQGAQQLKKIPTRPSGPVGEATPIGAVSQNNMSDVLFSYSK